MEITSLEVLPTPEHVATLERLGDEIAALSAHLDAAIARLLDLIREFDAQGGWNTGFRSCADWVSWRVGLDKGAARERVRVARALGTLPRLAHALAGGEISYSKVRALTRVATPETEERLLGVETLYQQSRAQAHATDPAQDVPTMEQQRADALALLAETALHQGIDPGTPGERYQVVVHVDAAVLADPAQAGHSVLEDGVRVPAGTSQRLACDASRVVMRHDRDGQVVEVGARTRTIPPALRRALQHRDRGCRFPGCGLRVGEGHHVRHWAAGGPTTLSNLALLCRRHHRCVHEEGYQVARQPDGALEFRRPDGRVLPDVPSALGVPADPLQALCDTNVAHGLHIDARTARTGWRGERLNVAWAIDVLHPRANPSQVGRAVLTQ
jgi:hypothetical protein